MSKPICAKCGLFFHPERNGQVFEEGKPFVGYDGEKVRFTATDGTEWTSYKLWRGDLWECRGCGAQIGITAVSNWAEHYQPDYEAAREACGGDEIPFVHDC